MTSSSNLERKAIGEFILATSPEYTHSVGLKTEDFNFIPQLPDKTWSATCSTLFEHGGGAVILSVTT